LGRGRKALIQVKAGSRASAMMSGYGKEPHMPAETVVVVTAIVAAFAIFGAVLAWAERQTHKTS